MSNLTKPAHQERSKINIESAEQAKSWAHALGVTKDELRCVIDKVGNSAASVRKEIENLRQHARDLCDAESDSATQ